jgi:acetyltransferase-like isoleucine patch superfamily enzyme
MNASTILRRFFLPRGLVTLILRIRFGAKVSHRAEVELSPLLTLAPGVQISSYTKIKANAGPLRIGANTSIAVGCMIGADRGGIEIGEDCLIGPNVAIVGNVYRYADVDTPMRLQGSKSTGITIGNDVLLGAGTCVLDGSVVGDGVIAVPNTVISGRIPPRAIVRGPEAEVLFVRR